MQAYVELNELMNDQQNQQGFWQERGRWVGYEESYDPEAGGWGPSHISYLTFKSLIQLRRTMNTGQNRAVFIRVHNGKCFEMLCNGKRKLTFLSPGRTSCFVPWLCSLGTKLKKMY